MSSYPDNRSGQSAAIFRLLTRQRGSTPEDPKEFRNPSKGELRQRMGGDLWRRIPFHQSGKWGQGGESRSGRDLRDRQFQRRLVPHSRSHVRRESGQGGYPDV